MPFDRIVSLFQGVLPPPAREDPPSSEDDDLPPDPDDDTHSRYSVRSRAGTECDEREAEERRRANRKKKLLEIIRSLGGATPKKE